MVVFRPTHTPLRSPAITSLSGIDRPQLHSRPLLSSIFTPDHVRTSTLFISRSTQYPPHHYLLHRATNRGIGPFLLHTSLHRSIALRSSPLSFVSSFIHFIASASSLLTRTSLLISLFSLHLYLLLVRQPVVAVAVDALVVSTHFQVPTRSLHATYTRTI